VLVAQLVPFIGAGGELVELADLPLQALALALRVAWAARACSSAASALRHCCQLGCSGRASTPA
jgi:hypothetical protein